MSPPRRRQRGIWHRTRFDFLQNRRGGLNLIYQGYLYTAERKYNSTVNWVCNKNSNMHLKCPARCVTAGDNSIKLSKKAHNHLPVYDDELLSSSSTHLDAPETKEGDDT